MVSGYCSSSYINYAIGSIPIRALHSDCKAIVLHGTSLGSTLNMSLTNLVRKLTYFPINVQSRLVGHLLGDASLVYSYTSVTPSFVFSQALAKFQYT